MEPDDAKGQSAIWVRLNQGHFMAPLGPMIDHNVLDSKDAMLGYTPFSNTEVT